MGLKITQGRPRDMMLMMLPLKQAGDQIAADMQTHHGTGKRCGVCGKAFNAVRKSRGIVRLTYNDEHGRLLMVAWLLCRKCSREAKRNGDKAPNCLRREAANVLDAVYLMTTKAKRAA